MEMYVGKKQFMALTASILLGILLFGFQNFATVSVEVAQKEKAKLVFNSCPYSPILKPINK